MAPIPTRELEHRKRLEEIRRRAQALVAQAQMRQEAAQHRPVTRGMTTASNQSQSDISRQADTTGTPSASVDSSHSRNRPSSREAQPVMPGTSRLSRGIQLPPLQLIIPSESPFVPDMPQAHQQAPPQPGTANEAMRSCQIRPGETLHRYFLRRAKAIVKQHLHNTELMLFSQRFTNAAYQAIMVEAIWRDMCREAYNRQRRGPVDQLQARLDHFFEKHSADIALRAELEFRSFKATGASPISTRTDMDAWIPEQMRLKVNLDPRTRPAHRPPADVSHHPTHPEHLPACVQDDCGSMLTQDDRATVVDSILGTADEAFLKMVREAIDEQLHALQAIEEAEEEAAGTEDEEEDD